MLIQNSFHRINNHLSLWVYLYVDGISHSRLSHDGLLQRLRNQVDIEVAVIHISNSDAHPINPNIALVEDVLHQGLVRQLDLHAAVILRVMDVSDVAHINDVSWQEVPTHFCVHACRTLKVDKVADLQQFQVCEAECLVDHVEADQIVLDAGDGEADTVEGDAEPDDQMSEILRREWYV